jgi:hypothetical protein
MIRRLFVSFVLAGSAVALANSIANAQSPNPVLLAPPAARAGMAPAPVPYNQPTPMRIPGVGASGKSRYVHVPGSRGRTVNIPAGAPFETFQDRVATCTQYGAASGLSPGKLATFTRSCAN